MSRNSRFNHNPRLDWPGDSKQGFGLYRAVQGRPLDQPTAEPDGQFAQLGFTNGLAGILREPVWKGARIRPSTA